MNEVGTPTPMRRTLLQRGLALLGGALGVGALGGEVHGRSAAVEAAPHTLELLGRRRASAGLTRGARSASQHVVSSGDLLEGPGGATIGSFHTNGLCLASTLGSPLPTESNIAFQTFVLAEGTLFGVGGGSPAGERTCAVLGGTGRYAGAHGTYVERVPSRPAGRDAVEFIFTLRA
jgi:hypothetical protein